jgi:hypothetical protein
MNTDQILALTIGVPLTWLCLRRELYAWRDDRKAARRQSHEQLMRELRRQRPSRGLM